MIHVRLTVFNIKDRVLKYVQNLKPEDITIEKALELLSGDNVSRSGRPKNKPKLEEAF